MPNSKMKPTYGVLGELRRVTTTLIEMIKPIKYVGSMDTEPDEQKILGVT